MNMGRQILKNVKTRYSEGKMISITNGSLCTMILRGSKTSAVRGMNSPKRMAITLVPFPLLHKVSSVFLSCAQLLISQSLASAIATATNKAIFQGIGSPLPPQDGPPSALCSYSPTVYIAESVGERGTSFLSSADNHPPC